MIPASSLMRRDSNGSIAVIVLYFGALFFHLGHCYQRQMSSSKNIDLVWYIGHVFEYNLTDAVVSSSCTISAVRVIDEFDENKLPAWLQFNDEFTLHGYSPQPAHARFTVLLFGKNFGYYVHLCHSLTFHIRIVSSSSSLQSILYTYLKDDKPTSLRKNWMNCDFHKLNILTVSFSTRNSNLKTRDLMKHGERLSQLLNLEHHLLQILPPESPYVLYKQLHSLSVVVSSVKNNDSAVTFSWPLHCDSSPSSSNSNTIHRYRRALLDDVGNSSTFSNVTEWHVTSGSLRVNCADSQREGCLLFFSSIVAFIGTPIVTTSTSITAIATVAASATTSATVATTSATVAAASTTVAATSTTVATTSATSATVVATSTTLAATSTFAATTSTTVATTTTPTTTSVLQTTVTTTTPFHSTTIMSSHSPSITLNNVSSNIVNSITPSRQINQSTNAYVHSSSVIDNTSTKNGAIVSSSIISPNSTNVYGSTPIFLSPTISSYSHMLSTNPTTFIVTDSSQLPNVSNFSSNANPNVSTKTMFLFPSSTMSPDSKLQSLYPPTTNIDSSLVISSSQQSTSILHSSKVTRKTSIRTTHLSPSPMTPIYSFSVSIQPPIRTESRNSSMISHSILTSPLIQSSMMPTYSFSMPTNPSSRPEGRQNSSLFSTSTTHLDPSSMMTSYFHSIVIGSSQVSRSLPTITDSIYIHSTSSFPSSLMPSNLPSMSTKPTLNNSFVTDSTRQTNINMTSTIPSLLFSSYSSTDITSHTESSITFATIKSSSSTTSYQWSTQSLLSSPSTYSLVKSPSYPSTTERMSTTKESFFTSSSFATISRLSTLITAPSVETVTGSSSNISYLVSSPLSMDTNLLTPSSESVFLTAVTSLRTVTKTPQSTTTRSFLATTSRPFLSTANKSVLPTSINRTPEAMTTASVPTTTSTFLATTTISTALATEMRKPDSTTIAPSLSMNINTSLTISYLPTIFTRQSFSMTTKPSLSPTTRRPSQPTTIRTFPTVTVGTSQTSIIETFGATTIKTSPATTIVTSRTTNIKTLLQTTSVEATATTTVTEKISVTSKVTSVPSSAMETETITIVNTSTPGLISASPSSIVTTIISATLPQSQSSSTVLPPVSDSVPIVLKPIGRIVVDVGRLLEFIVPKTAFYDTEDGDTRKLSLIALTSVSLSVDTLSWIYFNHTAQKFIFLPMQSDYTKQTSTGLASIHLKATDSQGKYAIDVFNVTIKTISSVVQFSVSITLQLNYDIFMSAIKTRIDVMQRISKYYGDNVRNSSLLLLGVTRGSTVVTITNTSISDDKTTCDKVGITRFVDVIKIPNSNSPQSSFGDSLSQYPITEITMKYSGVCVAATAGNQTENNSDLQFILPIIILSIILIIVLIIVVCLCRSQRQKRSFYLNGRKYRDGRPVLFPDESELKNLPITTKVVEENHPKSYAGPYDLDDERDGVLQYGAVSSEDDDDETSSDSSYSHQLPYEPPPQYMAPPPYMISYNDSDASEV